MEALLGAGTFRVPLPSFLVGFFVAFCFLAACLLFDGDVELLVDGDAELLVVGGVELLVDGGVELLVDGDVVLPLTVGVKSSLIFFVGR